MYEITFKTKLIAKGLLSCPEEYSFDNADYKVIVILPDSDDKFYDLESSAIVDNNDEILSQDEINYYMNLD